MDPKHASLIKKAIRMIDYMRADLVGILGETIPNSDDAPPTNPDGRTFAKVASSPLYAAFDTATAAQPDPEPIRLITGETDEALQRAAAMARELVAKREAADQIAQLDNAGITVQTETGLPARVIEPVENTDPEPSPTAPEITEYERLKRQLHASFRQNETMVCCAQHAPLGVSCRCPKCTGE